MKTPFPINIRCFAAPGVGLGQRPFYRGRAPGVALVIILIFIVLISGVLVAFLSRALTVRQVANSSANTVGVSLFADGAVDSVLGDFKQEIVDGSTAKQLPSGQWLYPPTNLTDTVPTRAGTSDSLPSLVKRSAFGVKFYPKGVARAVNSSSLLASTNGRRMTPARWNKGLLLTRDPADTSNTDFTPVGASAASNTWTYAPDWVLVARDGSNPTVWASTAADASAANNGFVIGRYAYEIYDEGGLLDANAVAYPSGTPNTPELTAAPAYRSNMAFADLRQLPGISNLSTTLQNSALDLMLKVRNYTSWDANPANFAENYYRFALPFPKGFLSVGNTALKDGRSDLLFSSRQDFLQFMLQALPTLGSFSADDQKSLQQQLPNAMPYLTHFSRSLEQPSITPDDSRPTIMQGGGGNSAAGNENNINPKFLEVRVTNAFTRNDGVTSAAAGEPLVKTRFALNRLAWLTYKGPIASDDGTLSSDQDVQTIIKELERRGLTDDFLKRGGPKNIRQYFGLEWKSYTDPETGSQTNVWRYDVHNGSGSGVGNITRLKDISALGREPDFVELLKAAINVGSIAKGAYTEGGAADRADFPPNYQWNQDTSTDFAVIQITANIIDQFDLDGYPTRIRYNIGGNYQEQEFDGVENLPYFYRSRVSGVDVREADPLQYFYENKPIKDTGVYVSMLTPEVWNPHDQNSPRSGVDANGNALLDPSGNPLFPTNFRIVANSTDPVSLSIAPQDGSMQNVHIEAAEPGSNRSWAADTSAGKTPPSPPFNGDFSNKPIRLTATTTALEFDAPPNSLGQGFYREPTVLMQVNVPKGSNLHPGTGNYFANPGAPAVAGRLNGLMNNDGSITNAPSRSSTNPTGESYIGMFLGTVPEQWIFTTGGTSRLQVLNYFIGGASETRYITYRVQTRDPGNPSAWITYDEKYANSIFDEQINQNGARRFAVSGTDVTDHDAVLGDDRSTNAWDPRTARFASVELTRVWNGVSYEFPITGTDLPRYGSLNTAANTLASNRPDSSSGFLGAESAVARGNPFWLQGMPNVAGWVPGGGQECRLGVTSQNSTTFSGDGKRWNTDPKPTGGGAQYYGDPDGTVRRAMGGYATATGGDTLGLPMTTGQTQSRPILLNRPFQSAAELGYVFAGTPWKNLSFFTPESGDTGLLDIFCVGEPTTDGLAAGRVNLNTRQAPVLQAILSGAYKDDHSVTSGPLLTAGSSGEAAQLASKLVARTSGVATNGQSPPAGVAQPLRNVGELVGRWVSGSGSSAVCDGFSTDVAAAFTDPNDQKTQRRREAPIRALSACGQTRVWNLMIDVVAQTGRYPANATGADRFVVEGEQRKWVHVAIDRLTGAVIDKQVEVVRE